jgi:hypothetical protein
MFEEEIARIGGDIEDEPEEEVPGHGSRKEWAKRIQSFLKEKGVSFEAEGEAVRIHVDSFTVEVMEAPGGEGYAIAITAPLPGSSHEALDEDVRKAVDGALKLAGLLGAEELKYELDTSIPGYPSMRIMVIYKEPEKLADALIKALEEYGVGGAKEPVEG